MREVIHNPGGMGSYGATCSEYGNQWFDENGVEWETCPACGKTGRVYNDCKITSPKEMAKEFTEYLKSKAVLKGLI